MPHRGDLDALPHVAGAGRIDAPATRDAVLVSYVRSDRKPARISSDRNSGCSKAAKCPPLGSLL